MKRAIALVCGLPVIVALAWFIAPTFRGGDASAGPPTTGDEVGDRSELAGTESQGRSLLGGHPHSDPLPPHGEEQAAESSTPPRNLAQIKKLGSASNVGSGHLARVVMNCVADILHAEGRGTRLEDASSLDLRSGYGPDLYPIVRQAWDGAWLFAAERDRFPLLFDLVELYREGGAVTDEQYGAALVLAEEADAAHASLLSTPPVSGQTRNQ